MTLKEAIMNRDKCTEEEANDLINDMVNEIENGSDIESVLECEGFEPDYVMDLLELL